VLSFFSIWIKPKIIITVPLTPFDSWQKKNKTAGGEESNRKKTMSKREVTVHKMKSFGLLNGSSASVEMLMSIELELKKILMTINNKSDPNEAYPSMLMLEMVTDCTTMRLHYQLALHGQVQQSYDTSVTNAEIQLPPLMPKYDLTFPEFKQKLQMDNHQQLDNEITTFISIESIQKYGVTKYENDFENIRVEITQELKGTTMTNTEKEIRIEQLFVIIEKLKKEKKWEEIWDVDIELTEKLIHKLER
jgi:hypothetical protein